MYKCKCCGHETLPDPPEDAVAYICPICRWENVDKTLGDHMPFLVSLEENSDNELHIILSAAVVGENTSDMTDGLSASVTNVVSKHCPILPGNKTIDIRFDNYIMYQVRNESYVSLDRTEARYGKYLCVFAESKLLAYLETVTDVQRGENGSTYPGPWRHYGIRTQNQIIDVVSHFEPMVTVKEITR